MARNRVWNILGVFGASTLCILSISCLLNTDSDSGPTPGPDGVLEVEYPNGGETLTIGQTYTLRFSQNAKDRADIAGYHDVYFTITDGQVLIPALTYPSEGSFDIVGTKGTFSWEVPDSVLVRGAVDPATGGYTYQKVPFPAGSTFKIAINSYESLSEPDSSDSSFSISR